MSNSSVFDELVELLEQMRSDYPQVHAIFHRNAEAFVRLLERRTGLLVETGHVRHLGRPVPVYEFRHLTFQEYLAGLALVDGRFPGRDRSRGLAEEVAPLAARIEEVAGEPVVVEHWREALRLCVSCCKDDDVDSVITAILTPRESEDPVVTARPRAILAALCLADEPNISEALAHEVLETFGGQVRSDEGGSGISGLL